MAVNDILLGSELGAEFDLGNDVANKVSIKVDGTTVTKNGSNELTAAPSVVTWDNATKIIQHTSGSGVVTNIDLSQFVADIYVNGGAYDPATMVLTLSDNDAGTPDITVDLSALLGPSTDANNSITAGADGKPFFDASTVSGVSTDANQILTVGADGKPHLECDDIKNGCTSICQSVFGTDLFRAFAL